MPDQGTDADRCVKAFWRLYNPRMRQTALVIMRNRQNRLYTAGIVIFTWTLTHHRAADPLHRCLLAPTAPAAAGQPPATAIDPPRSPQTGRRPPRWSSSPAATASARLHLGRTPDPRPPTGCTPGVRTHGQATGGTDGLPGKFAAAQRHQVHLNTHARREVWRRDGGRCSYVDPHSGRRCGSRFLLELDHIVPFALGGGAEPDNLRLRCSAHHRFRHREHGSPPDGAT